MSLKEKAKKFYEYAFTIVWVDSTFSLEREAYTNLIHNRAFIEAERRMYKPNQDTLYSFLPVQLEYTPYILEIPKIDNRYLLVNLLNMKTDVVLSTGTKASDNGAGKYIILYKDQPVPAGYEDHIQIRSDDSRNYFIIRTESFGEHDYANANAIQDRFVMKPLYPEKIAPKGHGKPNGSLTVSFMEQLPPETFISNFISTLSDTTHDEEIISILTELVGDLDTFSFNKLTAETRNAIEEGFREAYSDIITYTGPEEYISNGWHAYVKDVAHYGKKYRYRAFVNWFAYMANLETDTVYPTISTDSNGVKLDSSRTYKLHFNKNGLPPAKHFWSVILYGSPSDTLVINPYKKYLVNSHSINGFTFNSDGSLDVLISREKPADETLFSNWIPAPDEDESFTLLMRVYGPEDILLNKEWEFPTLLPTE